MDDKWLNGNALRGNNLDHDKQELQTLRIHLQDTVNSGGYD